jgi:aspartyl-tRNA(Asn)/glutamyl-tRNA(Gln) amidotransferase subunit C
MTIKPDDVRHIAHLARLAVDEQRIEGIARELSSILDHMEVLQKVDTERLPAVSGVGAGGTPLREDTGSPVKLERPLEAFAPQTRDGFFIVPRLATHEDDAERSP